MSDHLPDTPPLAITLICPTCLPDYDQPYDVLWCSTHEPGRGGIDDALVKSDGYLAGSGEAGGSTNAEFCRLIHGGKR